MKEVIKDLFTSKNAQTFSKRWTNIILSVALLDIQAVFLLAFLGKENIAETLGVALVTEIIGVFLTYSVKALFENKDKYNNERQHPDYQQMIKNSSDDEAVG